MPRPQVPRQENKVNNNIKVEMEKRLLSHQLDVSGGSKRPTRNLYHSLKNKHQGHHSCWS